MRRIAILTMLLGAMAVPAAAQYEPAPMEVFGGISYFLPDSFRGTPKGGQGEFVINLSEKFAMVIESGFQAGDVSVVIGGIPFPPTKFTFGTVQTGFRYYWVRNKRFSVFGHILTGGMFGTTAGGKLQGGSFTPGGGVEINITRNFAIRPLQADLILSNLFRGSSTHRRFGAGFVYRFGD